MLAKSQRGDRGAACWAALPDRVRVTEVTWELNPIDYTPARVQNFQVGLYREM